jgi:deoxyribonuclease V
MGGEQVGVVLRTRDGVRPLFVSVGHRVTLAEAKKVVLRAAPRYRIPEPLRRAHVMAGGLRDAGANGAEKGRLEEGMSGR